jgi:hypothetical protein
MIESAISNGGDLHSPYSSFLIATVAPAYFYKIFSTSLGLGKKPFAKNSYPSEEPICFGLGIVRNSVNSVLVPIRG